MWAGRHPHAPVAVASRPSYFAELNVVETVLNLLTHEPGFLESQHFQQTLSSDFVALDQPFLVEVRGRLPPPYPSLCGCRGIPLRCCTHFELTCIMLQVIACPASNWSACVTRLQTTCTLPCHGSPFSCAAGTVC